jgi:rhodanese-related sulfurtransferase
MDTQPKHITCEHLLDLHSVPADDREHVVVDLRDETDWEVGHIKDSVHLPHKELHNLESLVPEKDKRVIVVLGPTQQKDLDHTHAVLAEMGYANVEFLKDGIDRWCEIADVEVKDVLANDLTPEETGMTGDGSDEIGKESTDSDPMY